MVEENLEENISANYESTSNTTANTSEPNGTDAIDSVINENRTPDEAYQEQTVPVPEESQQYSASVPEPAAVSPAYIRAAHIAIAGAGLIFFTILFGALAKSCDLDESYYQKPAIEKQADK